jgi:branched-chain amino acid aminotransferase
MPDELGRAQEVFLTGTAAEITPVREVDRYRFTPGAITKTLMEDFDKAVGRG